MEWLTLSNLRKLTRGKPLSRRLYTAYRTIVPSHWATLLSVKVFSRGKYFTLDKLKSDSITKDFAEYL